MRLRSVLLLSLLALLAPLVVAVPAVAVEDVTPARVEGETRVDTAAAIARLAHPEGVEAAVVGQGMGVARVSDARDDTSPHRRVVPAIEVHDLDGAA